MYPFAVLGVSADAGDEAIRAAYVRKVKVFPPDADPERFKEISNAYEKIKTAELRRAYILFDDKPEPADPFDAFRRLFLLEETRTPPSINDLKEYLRSCLK